LRVGEPQSFHSRIYEHRRHNPWAVPNQFAVTPTFFASAIRHQSLPDPSGRTS
jgi:hypothetical protein